MHCFSSIEWVLPLEMVREMLSVTRYCMSAHIPYRAVCIAKSLYDYFLYWQIIIQELGSGVGIKNIDKSLGHNAFHVLMCSIGHSLF